MAHPYHHALASVKKWGGDVSDYLPLHTWFDQSKGISAVPAQGPPAPCGGHLHAGYLDRQVSAEFSLMEVVVPVVHRRGPAARAARIKRASGAGGGEVPVDPPGRAPGCGQRLSSDFRCARR